MKEASAEASGTLAPNNTGYSSCFFPSNCACPVAEMHSYLNKTSGASMEDGHSALPGADGSL